VAYYNKTLYDKAIGDFNKSLELDPKLADAYFSKALALEAAGRPAEAREAYAAFLRYAPPEAKDQIEQARSKIGRQ
jgi:tetratricopeptide (TPR) repeat protein